MSVEDEVVRILQSLPRTHGGAEQPDLDIANLRAAVREVQNAVVHVVKRLDELRGE